MDDYESLSHSKWECKYHVVFIPKYRRKTLYAELRRHLGEVFRKLAEQKESRIEKRQGTKSRQEVVGWRSPGDWCGRSAMGIWARERQCRAEKVTRAEMILQCS